MLDSTVLPRVKLQELGADELTDLELIMVFVGNGCNGYDYRAISKDLLLLIHRVGVNNLTLNCIRSVKGLGLAKASALFAMIELYKRYSLIAMCI